MKKILIIFGTRPEAIKMAPVIKSLKTRQRFQTRICVTAQHREMLDQVLNLFEIRPDYDLNIMKLKQDLYHVTCEVIRKLKQVLDKERPDLILVHGDTTTTMAASLAAFYGKIPLGHVEAGLRTQNKYAPYPEEINRKLTSCIADIHFAPTKSAKDNLLREGIPENAIHITGNTVIDALLDVIDRIKDDLEMDQLLNKKFSYIDLNRKIILVTGHRRENFGDGFERICKAFKILGERNDVQIIYPVHLNPNVREPVNRILSTCPNINLIEPLDYLPFVYLMSRSHIVITDSGGVQEEAPSLGKPVLVMREATERPEAVEAGTAKIVGFSTEKIVQETQLLLDNRNEYEKMAQAMNPYGDGKSAERIVDILGRIFYE